jgi:asparagine synthase (glutamine-hydrolysing)
LEGLLGRPCNIAESGFYRIFRAHADLGAQQLYDAIGVLPPDDSRFEAAGLAAAPIELPYHDIDLWNFVRRLPAHRRMIDGETKLMLHKLFSRYLPSYSTPLKKRYFNIPLRELLARENFRLIGEYLDPQNLRRMGLVDPKVAQSWIASYFGGDQSLLFKVWALLLLHAWLGYRPQSAI